MRAIVITEPGGPEVLQSIVGKVEAGDYKASPAQVFPFEQTAEAHRVMDAGRASGKLVVSLDGFSTRR